MTLRRRFLHAGLRRRLRSRSSASASTTPGNASRTDTRLNGSTSSVFRWASSSPTIRRARHFGTEAQSGGNFPPGGRRFRAGGLKCLPACSRVPGPARQAGPRPRRPRSKAAFSRRPRRSAARAGVGRAASDGSTMGAAPCSLGTAGTRRSSCQGESPFPRRRAIAAAHGMLHPCSPLPFGANASRSSSKRAVRLAPICSTSHQPVQSTSE